MKTDKTLWVLIGATFVSLVAGLADDLALGWIEGVSILLGVCLLILLNSLNSHLQDAYFQRLSERINAVTCTVIRDGHEQEIPVSQLVVGDLLKVKTGMTLPADGVFVQAFGVKIDESEVTGEEDLVRKDAYRKPMDVGGDPFALAGSRVEEGSGSLLVCAVGRYSTQRRTEILIEAGQTTPLQQRLQSLSGLIGKWGIIVSLLIFCLLVLHAIFITHFSAKYILRDLVSAVMLVVVAVPEGLSLAFKLSLAVAVEKMQEANSLVRHLAAPERIGSVTDICTGKTGLFTLNKMQVMAIYALGKDRRRLKAENVEMPADEMRTLLVNCCCINSDSSLVYVPNQEDEEKGNRIECALLALVKRWKVDYEAVRRVYPLLTRIPFSPQTKWMGSVCQVDSQVHVYIKGAPATVVGMCGFRYSSTGPEEFSSSEKERVLTTVMNSYTSEGFRTLALAYKAGPYNFSDWLKSAEPNIDFFTSELVFLGLVALCDPVRKCTKEAVAEVLRANITIRLVTGDHIDTAIAAGKELGLLPSDYHRGSDYLAMEGADLQQFADSLINPTASSGPESVQQRTETISRVIQQVRVLASATPEQKLLLVLGLTKILGRTVAVTVKDSSEMPILKVCDVALATGLSGSQAIIESADIILANDDFCSVAAAVTWGRNTVSSVRKFIQFQLTVTLVVLLLCLGSAAVAGQIPMAPIHLLWINAITDLFAAFALATDLQPALPIDFQLIARSQPLLDLNLVRGVLGSALYQVLTLLFILLFAPWCFDFFTSWGERDWSNEGFVQFTMFVHTFVFLQVFNLLNCSSLLSNGVLSGSKILLLVVLLTAFVQVVGVEIGGKALFVNRLSLWQHGTCVLLGAGGLLGRQIGTLLPVDWLQWSQSKVDLPISPKRYSPMYDFASFPPPIPH